MLLLTATGNGVVALLQAGSGASTSLIAAWADAGGWALSAPLPIGASVIGSMSSGPGQAVAVSLAGGRGETLSGPGSSGARCPGCPLRRPRWLSGRWPGGRADGARRHVHRLAARGCARWRLTQTIQVTIPYGSSS